MKRYLALLMAILCFASVLAIPMEAAAPKIIGKVLTTDIRAYINGAEIPAYNIDGNMVIVGSDLRNYGFSVVYNNSTRTSSVTLPKDGGTWAPMTNMTHYSTIGEKVMDVYKTDIKVLINGKEVQAYNVDNKMAFKFSELKVFGNYKYDNATRTTNLSFSMKGGLGTRSNPYTADANKTIPYQEDGNKYRPARNIKITCANVIKGEAGNILAGKLYSKNKIANGSQEWMFFDLRISYVSSSKGEDDSMQVRYLTSCCYDYDAFYFKPDGSPLNVAAAPYYNDMLGGYDPYEIVIYPGATSVRVLCGVLSDKYDGDILLKVPSNSDGQNTWVQMNSDTNVISTKAGLDKYLKDTVPAAERGVEINLKNALPQSINNSGYGDKLEASFRITDFSYTSSGTSATIIFSGEKTYDSNGSGQSRSVKVGWKLYNSEGYVIDDGTASGTSIKVGEKFKNCKDNIYSLEPGEYTLEFMSVN